MLTLSKSIKAYIPETNNEGTLYILENTLDIDKLFSKYYNVVKED